jgi:hypothetical protein
MIEIILGALGGAATMWVACVWYYTKASAEDKAKLHAYEDKLKAGVEGS